jgi:signal transduction histidine kinase
MRRPWVTSLTVKLVLAFLLTSVAGMLLAAVVVRQLVAREFDSYVIAQQREIFIDEVSAFYAVNGGWRGLDAWVRSQPARPPAIPLGRLAPEDGHRPGPWVRFVVVDSGGKVVLPSGRFEPGRPVEPFEITAGAPIVIRGARVGTVLTPDLAEFRNVAEQRYLIRTDRALLIAGLIMVGVALALGVLLARLITRPLRELSAAAQRMADGDLEQHVPVRSRDELGALAVQFNHMSADLARATALRRQMTADVAHDLRTPLTVIAGYLEALRDRVLQPTPERLNAMYDETRFLLHLVDDLHTITLADADELALERRPLDPRPLLERVASVYHDAAAQQGVALRIEAPAALPPIDGDGEQLARALSNLVNNALRYTGAGGSITLRAAVEGHGAKDEGRRTKDESAPGAGAEHPEAAGPQASVVGRWASAVGRWSFVAIEVIDTGEGIAPEHLPSVFERFYRADPSRQEATGGSGLGLAIVRSIVEAHGGQISATSALGQGTSFKLLLPLAADAAPP